ncbi:MAG TPA: HNH endonuclease signature motif containing protein [Anaerolineales bacterium]|nr:HNH endonuclease signature motif containing protein [Anaerolineales bacterium]
MKSVQAIVYRYLSDAEFFNIYKPPGTEKGGGGQKYIDFPKKAIHLSDWEEFFEGVTDLVVEKRAKGPSWTFPIKSIGVPLPQEQRATIYQRRQQSVCIAAQHIYARNQNRVTAWHPDQGFPVPANPADRHQLPPGLVVYLVRTVDNEVWAGWTQNSAGNAPIYKTPAAGALLDPMLSDLAPNHAGYLEFEADELQIDETDAIAPFTAEPLEEEEEDEEEQRERQQRRSYRRRRSEDEILNSLFAEDEDVEDGNGDDMTTRQVVMRVRRRNTRAVQDLKELYKHRCQISGEKYAFQKQDGTFYSEAHHLTPLGSGGADDPRNIVVISPLIHRMLHYANVSEIDLTRITQRDDGWSTLEITINGTPHTIEWHPKHAERVLDAE